jgi:hypothetical protein
MLRDMGLWRKAALGACVRRALAILCLFVAGCGDDSQPDDAAETRWALVLEELDSALMSVTGTASDDVWTVGANSGSGPLVLHFDGASWQRFPIDVDADLWWVHVADRDTVVCGGSNGTIVRGNSTTGFVREDTPGESTVYGVFGSASDLWAVGGDPDSSPGFVWRNQGDGWIDVTAEISDEPLPPVFKLSGTSDSDLWFVGMDGLAFHWDGERFELADSGTQRRLFTVHGTGQPPATFAAVGGFGSAVIIEHDGSEWHDATPENPPNQLFGVSMTSGVHGYAVGEDGAVVERTAHGWADRETGLEIFNAFHSVWVDPDGGIWAAGGELIAALNAGMLLHGDPSGRGAAIPDRIEE